jgi:amidase
MNIRCGLLCLFVLLTILKTGWSYARSVAPSIRTQATQEIMDRDLLEVTVPRLEQLYRSHKYTVSDVVRWYLARIEKYNGIYRAVQTVDLKEALATAAREDAEAKARGSRFVRGPLWGVPIVIKANTSIKGLITTDGWKGYTIPGHELVAPTDATIVDQAERPAQRTGQRT